MNQKKINIIGAGLAGCEAANFLANHGFKVDLYEKRPKVKSEAHHTDFFGELVCSNSLKSSRLDNACGLLKKEIELMGSLIMDAAKISSVPSGDALAVDRNIFAQYITKKIKDNKNITIHYEDIEALNEDEINIVCTGPLTSEKLLNYLSNLTGEKCYSFFDASAPIVYKDSIDLSKVYFKSRYDHRDNSYINCPMNQDEYLKFYNALLNAEKAPLHSFDTNYFEGCLPIEVIASRGIDTLRFGPLKPVGLEHDNQSFYAVVQLRQDDLIGDFYNIVGFQTNLTYKEQARVFRMIPGLENAKFARYGLMHRNSYIYSPQILADDLSIKGHSNIYIAGQLSGVEGYIESAATGLLAAYYVCLREENKNFEKMSFYTVLGSLVRYITHTGINGFQPMNANYGIVYKANKDSKDIVAQRSLSYIEKFIKQI